MFEFETTHWSLVRAAGRDPSEQAREALEHLCQKYWQPLYVYVRRRVQNEADALDLVQAFFARLLEKHYLADADQNRGRFRSFLITAFKHFLANEWDKAKAQKRGGSYKIHSLDLSVDDSVVSFELESGVTSEQLYERQWARSLINLVKERLQAEYTKQKKQGLFDLLKDFLASDQQVKYIEVTEKLGMKEPAVRMVASRMRKRFRQLLREEIAHTVSNDEDVDGEIRHLFMIFRE